MKDCMGDCINDPAREDVSSPNYWRNRVDGRAPEITVTGVDGRAPEVNFTSAMQPQTITFEAIDKIRQELEQAEANRPKEWMLVSPDGRLWKGPLKDLLMVVAQERFKAEPFSFVERNIT